MKVLFDHSIPFALAHGGFQIQIQQTKLALLAQGIEVEWLRWWDPEQSGDIIHYFGRPSGLYIELAHRKGLKVVISELLGGLGARGKRARTAQKFIIEAAKRLLPSAFTARMAWNAFEMADACIALTSWEASLMGSMFNAPSERLFVVPNGVESVFFESPARERGQWLVCTATINPGKRGCELALAAIEAKTPLWFIGKPYTQDDPYYQKFLTIIESAPTLLRFEGAINNRAQLAGIYRQARGFVLLSAWESLSLAALEAAACELPLLLSDLPWAHSSFGRNAQYCTVPATISATAQALQKFYDAATTLPLAPKPKSWGEIAIQLTGIYQGVLAGKS